MASFHEILNTRDWVLVDFYADWCGPCKAMAPEFKKAAENWDEKVTFLKVDVDRNTNASAHFQIQSIPTLILFKKGQPVWKQPGALTYAQINQLLEQHLK